MPTSRITTELSRRRQILRRLLRPLSRALVRLRDPARLRRRCSDPGGEAGLLPLFVVATPGEESLVRRNVGALRDQARLCVVLNGCSRRAARELVRILAPARSIRLSSLPGFPVRHGTVISLLLEAIDEDFGVLDADCFVRDPALVRRPAFAENELLAAPDHPHFFNLNRVTGRRFPRTHFLIFHLARVREVMRRYRVDAEKRSRVPRRLAPALAAEGYGEHNYPRSHLRFFDTLLLLMALAFKDGLEVRWLPVEIGRDQILHWKEQAELVQGLRARARSQAGRGGPAAAPGRSPRPDSVLICHSHLDRFSGSEICALELAEAWRRLGVRVVLMTRRLRHPMRRELAAGGFRVYHPGRQPPPGERFDLILNFHRDMERWLERYRIEGRRRIFYSLSPLSRRAVPGRGRVSYDRLLAVSAEARVALERRGLGGAEILPNWAPEEMFAAFGPRVPRLERVLCVSNHLPPELRRLAGPLRARGARLRFLGRRSGGGVRRVDADLLASFDLVISIGKTVQYGLAAGLPVYCYDRWGGHGYLSPAALDHAEATNFSGRCCGRRLTAEAIAADVEAGFEAAFAARRQLHAEARRRYRLLGQLERLS